MHWWHDFEPIVQRDVPLDRYTWYKLGGPAELFFTPPDQHALATLLRRARDASVEWRVLGGGANLLVHDEGVRGAVIHLRGRAFEAWECPDAHTVRAAAGVDLTKLVKHAADHGWLGFERLAGIPASVGGAVRMNAGGKHGAIGELVRNVTVVTGDGRIEQRSADTVRFAYRSTALDDCVVVAATFEFEPSDRAVTRERFRAIWHEKHASQPPVSDRTAGCIFKNPPGRSAGALIDQAGLKGQRRGGAEISTRHANFILAHPGCRAADIFELIAHIQERVAAVHGADLELEVKVW
ncbi:MAG: UDP-N-acetylenolpyruvoylglucosamine reductase [Phycisphaerae bacterium]|nr:UDP-N-acetylenolpyruvoylglucosamine reductase [Phycisphaerae bacterium]